MPNTIEFPEENKVIFTNKENKKLFLTFEYQDHTYEDNIINTLNDSHWTFDLTPYDNENPWTWESYQKAMEKLKKEKEEKELIKLLEKKEIEPKKEENIRTNSKYTIIGKNKFPTFSKNIKKHIDGEQLDFMIKFVNYIWNNIYAEHFASDIEEYTLKVVLKKINKDYRKDAGFTELSLSDGLMNLYLREQDNKIPSWTRFQNVFIHEMGHFVDLIVLKDLDKRKSLSPEIKDSNFYAICWEQAMTKYIVKEECYKKPWTMVSWYAEDVDYYEDFAETFLSYIRFKNQFNAYLLKYPEANLDILKQKFAFMEKLLPFDEEFEMKVAPSGLKKILNWEYYSFYNILAH